MAQVSSLTILKASEIGCILDCDINTGQKIGGGVATDNTAIINAFLATATEQSPVHLIIDGGSISSGIEIAPGGHTTIEGLGWDTGFFVKSGANSDGINNAGGPSLNPFTPVGSPPTSGNNVIVRNLRINGNRGNGTDGNSTSGDPRGITGVTWYCGINLINLNHVLIDHVWTYDIATYSILLNNVSDFIVSNSRFEAPTLAINTDGVHVGGLCENGRISNCYFSVGDDSIALNAPEGYGGNISRILVDNCDMQNGYSMLRVYSSGETSNTIDAVTVTNCIANLSNLAFNIGNGVGAGNANSIVSFSVTNCTITAPLLASVTNNIEMFELTAIKFITSGSSNGVQIAGATLGTLKINGLSVLGGTLPYLFDVPSGAALSCLLLDDLDPRNFTALASTNGFTQVAAIGGASLAQTGFQIPDAVARLSTAYISATSPNAGKLCIQHTAGTVIALG